MKEVTLRKPVVLTAKRIDKAKKFLERLDEAYPHSASRTPEEAAAKLDNHLKNIHDTIEGSRIRAAQKRMVISDTKRVGRALGLMVPKHLGQWAHIPRNVMEEDWQKSKETANGGWWYLSIPALTKQEMAKLRTNLLAAAPDLGPDFCPDARDKYKKDWDLSQKPPRQPDEIYVSDALVRELLKPEKARNLSFVLNPLLARAERRLKRMDTLCDKLNEVSGFPQWQTSLNFSRHYDARTLKLVCPMPWAEKWNDEYSPPDFVPRPLVKAGFRLLSQSAKNEPNEYQLSLSANHDGTLTRKVNQLFAKPELGAELKRFFNKVFMLAFPDFSVGIQRGSPRQKISRQERNRWHQWMYSKELWLTEHRTGAALLAAPNLPDEAREFIYRKVPAARPLPPMLAAQTPE